MALFRKKDGETKQKSRTASENIQEIYREKKRQLKFAKAELDSEKEQLEKDAAISRLQTELEHICGQIQMIRENNRKRWHKIIVLWAFVIAGGAVLCIAYYRYSDSQTEKKLAEYRQQLEADLAEYSGAVEKKKQDVQETMKELEQQLELLQESQ